MEDTAEVTDRHRLTDRRARQTVIDTIFSQKPTATGVLRSEVRPGRMCFDSDRPFVVVGTHAIAANLATGEVKYFGGRDVTQPGQALVEDLTHEETNIDMAQRVGDWINKRVWP